MSSSTSRLATARAAPSAQPGAIRGGALLLGAMVASIGATYVFYLVAGRLLGPEDYGTLAALLALVTIGSLPFNALQMELSREVSDLVTRGEEDRAGALTRALVGFGSVATVGLCVLFLVAMAPLGELLNIEPLWPLVLAGVALAPAIIFPILLGDLQGRQQFRALSTATAFPLVFRLVVFLVLAALGWRLYGALTAMAIGAFAGVALLVWWRREGLWEFGAMPRAPSAPFLAAVVPVMVAILGVTALTNVDVLIVKARTTGEDAGLYAAASAFAKVAFFLPMAIVGVLFPRVAARRARGLPTSDILGRALVVTVGFCAVLFLAYLVLGDALVRLTYGAEFDEAASLLPLFGIGMTCFSVANVLASYHLSRHEPRFAWVVAAAAACQAVVLVVVPADLETFLWANAAIGAALLVAHEAVMGSSLPAVRAGLAHVVEELALRARLRRWPGRLRDAAAARRAGLLEAAAVLAGATAFCLVITWPLLVHLDEWLLGASSDALATAADFWRQAEFTGYHITGTTYISHTGAPFGWEQGNGVNIQSSLAYFPAYLLTELFGEIAAYNVVTLAGLVLSGAAMYWLVRRITGSALVATWAGIVFIVFPWHLAKAEAHGSLTHLEGFPLLVLALIAWYQRPGARALLYLAGATTILWLSSGYYGLISIVALAALLPITAWFHRLRFGLAGAAGRLALAGGTAILVAGVIYAVASLGKARGEIAPGRETADLAYYGARIWEFFVPAYDNIIFGDLTSPWLSERLHLSNFSETSLYLGALTLLLALGYVGFCLLRWRGLAERRRFLCAACVAMVVVAVLFMLPHPVNVGRLSIGTPPWLLWSLVPQFRVPTRFMALLMTGLVPLAALGLMFLRTGLARRVEPGVARRWAVTGLVAAVAAISFLELSISPPAQLTKVGVLEEYRLLSAAPRGVVAEYPMNAAGEDRNSLYLFAQRFHRRPLLNGAPMGTFPEAIRQVVTDPSEPGVAGGLATLGVTAVIARPGIYPYATGPLKIRESLGPGYELLGRAAAGPAVWKVVAPPSPLAVFTDGFSFSERLPGRSLSRWMVSSPATIEIVAPKAGRYLARFAVESFKRPRRLVIRGDAGSWGVEVPVEGRELTIPIDLPRGRSRLLLTIAPGPAPVGTTDPRSVSILMSNWLFEERSYDAPLALTPLPDAAPR